MPPNVDHEMRQDIADMKALLTFLCKSVEEIKQGERWENCGSSQSHAHMSHRLAEWASNFQISHAATANLLDILQDFHPDLPSDPITLLHTTRDYELRDITGSSYYHLGMTSCVSLLKYNHLKAMDFNRRVWTLHCM